MTSFTHLPFRTTPPSLSASHGKANTRQSASLLKTKQFEIDSGRSALSLQWENSCSALGTSPLLASYYFTIRFMEG
jgi:hypothetical protein